MNILWLNDYTIKEVPAGGAEITDSYVIQAGRILGHDINVVRPDLYKAELLNNVDLVIFSNNFDFHDNTKSYIFKNKPYIVYSHDIGRWGDVVRRQPDMFKNAKASIFLSPGHRDYFSKYLVNAKNIFCVPPHIPLDFYNSGKLRKSGVLYAGNVHTGKGLENVIKIARKNREINFDFCFHRGQQNLLSEIKSLMNCKLVGFVPKEQIMNTYNSYQYFIHLPVMYECFGRAIIEALFCGCKVIHNKNIGAFSYGGDPDLLRKMTIDSHFEFWRVLERAGIIS